MKKIISLALISFLIVCLNLFSPAIANDEHDANVVSAENALSKLMEGNKRFVSSTPEHIHQDSEKRKELLNSQHPFAVVLCCSDSRVVPELIFDQGIGDIFVIRVAGNIVSDDVLGSIEYGTEHLNTKLVVVLGHQHCGAVTAATKSDEAEGHIDCIVKAIAPAVEEAKEKEGDIVKNSIIDNVKMVQNQIINSKPLINNSVKNRDVKVIGAYYDMETGKVNVIE